MMWSFEQNGEEFLSQFSVLLDKDSNSVGSFQTDYVSICEQNKVIPCPYIKSFVVNDGKEQIKVANGMVDLPSWRAMLLACACINSKVVDIYVHSCQLTPQHVIDLSKALERMSICTVVRFQYLYLLITPETTPLWIDALKSLFSDTCCLEYISFKGCRFGSEILQGAVSALSTNYKLRSFNLADNLLNDDVVMELLKAIKLKTNINEICLSNNQITGQCLQYMGQLLTGLDVTAEDEATIKANTKILNEKNKIIKDNNKKRKKSGLPEIVECITPTEYIAKKDGKNVLTNRNFLFFDFALQNGYLEVPFVRQFLELIQQNSVPVVAATVAATEEGVDSSSNNSSSGGGGGGGKLTVSFKGVNSDSSESNHEQILNDYVGDWVQILV